MSLDVFDTLHAMAYPNQTPEAKIAALQSQLAAVEKQLEEMTARMQAMEAALPPSSEAEVIEVGQRSSEVER